MFLRANGLFGWIDTNNKRSVALFAAFLITFHLLGLAALAGPLMISHPDYAPFVNWRGYALVVMPILTVAGAAVFGVQYFWQTKIVRRRLKFRYVDEGDEPRLCRIAEPLVIAAGIQPPFLALIEDPAMNAFACGVRRADTVIVVTRGLLNGLNDDELGGVLAHEIAHIRDGDIRLMAAANTCTSSIEFLFLNWRQNPWGVAAALLGTLAMPWMFVIILALGLIRQISYWLSQAVRLAIASSREFIADAFSVRLTQNPAALVSALCKIDGRSRLQAAGSFEAIMIDGPADGEQASHPRIKERIAALVSTTGALALEGLESSEVPSPNVASPSTRGFGRKGLPAAAPPAAIEADAAFHAPANRTIFALATRIARNSPYNVFGIQKKLNVVLVGWVLLFGAINHDALANPARLAARFDPGSMATVSQEALERDCRADFRWIVGQRRPQITYKKTQECARVARATEQREQASEAKDDAWVARTVATKACFVSILAVVPGSPENGYWPLSKTDTNVSPQLFSLQATDLDPALSQRNATDAELKQYVDNRRRGLSLLADFYGPPGVNYGQQALLQPEHEAVVKRLRERLADPNFVATLSATDRAEYRLLVDRPADFVPCKVKVGHYLLPPSNLASAEHVSENM